MRGIFCGTTTKTNEEYRIVIKKRIKFIIGIIIIGIITTAVALYAELCMDAVISEHILGFYTGVGTGLVVVGIIMLIKNKMLLGNEEKLKENRLSNTDERIQAIGNKAFRVATFVMLIAIYATALIGGIFIPEIIQILIFIVCAFLLAYAIAFKYFNSKM